MIGSRSIDEIFCTAIEFDCQSRRESWLDEACGNDADLRRQIDRLIIAHFRGGSIVDSPAHSVDANLVVAAAERLSVQVGPYKLLQQIGEGGMGTVFMAEQTHPVRRRVAVKVIKPGMDSRQIVARFQAERQALAVMDHVNIARVLDAGEMDSGRPYFVMELVQGTPIAKYCDDARLTLRERLELFVPVCQAIQHAHQKGIIHRDIKPSNVLVALYDGKPVPKVIDFGVAKATEQGLTEKTLFTQLGTMIGTLEYMSPEQAEMSPLEVDTRSDIYSLGVLLYELLTGSTPIVHEQVKQVAFAEIVRQIKEVDPPRPSTRLSDSGEALASISASRRTEPSKLTKLLRGDLDWIVMKTLEKDRARRYETADAFAADLQRYLDDEPVQARPPSAWYWSRKFVRRNRAALTVFAILSASFLLAASGIGWAALDRAGRDRQQLQDRAVKQAEVAGQIETILENATRLAAEKNWAEALRSVERAEPLVALADASPEVRARVGQTLAHLKLVARLDEIRGDSGTIWGFDLPEAERADRRYAEVFREAGIDFDASPTATVVEQIRSRPMIASALLPVLDDWIAVRTAGGDAAATRRLSDVLYEADPDEWRRMVREALSRKDVPALEALATSSDVDRQPAATVALLYAAVGTQGTIGARGETLLQWAQRRFPDDYWINHRLGTDLVFSRRPNAALEGIGFLRAAVALRPESAHAIMNLANGYTAMKQYDRSEACLRHALAISPRYSGCYSNLGMVLAAQGRHNEAIDAFGEAIRLSPDAVQEAYAELSLIHSSRPDESRRDIRRAAELAQKVVEKDPRFGNHWTALGVARYREGRWTEAQIAFEKALQLDVRHWNGAIRWEDAVDWLFLAMCHQRLGQETEARRCYESALSWMDRHQPSGELALRVHAETSALLGIQAGEAGVDQAISHYERGQALKNQGRTDEANEAFSRAIERYELLTIAFPATPEYVNRLVELLPKLGRKREVEFAYRRALDGLAALEDPTPEQRLRRSIYCNELAHHLSTLGRRAEGEGFCRQGIRLKRDLAIEFPEEPEYRFHLAHSHRGLANILADSDHDGEVIEANTDAGALFDELAAEPTASAEFRQWNAHALWQLGGAWAKLERLDDARRAYARALTTFRELSKVDPSNRFFRQEQGFSLRLLANVARRAGHDDVALRHLCDSAALYEDLLAEAPEYALYRRESASVHLTLSGDFAHHSRFEEADRALARATALYGELYESSPPEAPSKHEAANWFNDVAWPLVMRADSPPEAVRLAEAMARQGIELNAEAGHIWSTLAMARYRSGNWADAKAAEEKARELGFQNEALHLFAAMTLCRLEKLERARERYAFSRQWIDESQTVSDDMRSLRTEAEELVQGQPAEVSFGPAEQ